MQEDLPTKYTKAHEDFSGISSHLSSRVATRRGDPARSGLLPDFATPIETFVGNTYYVYIITNRRNGTLYTGVTNSLQRRIWQYKNKVFPGFSAKYDLHQLVYFESFRDITNAIAREKQIKAGSRAKKLELIERENPEWKDLSADWFE